MESHQARLLIRPEDGRTVMVGTGERVSIGRDGEVRPGAEDDHLHGVVCFISVTPKWEIEVPQGNSLWVDVMRGDESVWSGKPGARFGFDEADALLRVRTVVGTHTARLSFAGPGVQLRVPSTTRRSAPTLRLEMAPHRSLIVACSERVKHGGGLPVLGADLASALQLGLDTSERRMLRGCTEAAGWMVAAGVEPPHRDRAPIVDWLVCTGLVDEGLVARAMDAEQARRAVVRKVSR